MLRQTGLSPLGPLACNTAAPDEGNMYLLGRVGSDEQKRRFLEPLVRGEARSAFFMTEPAEDGGAGSDPSMMRTTAVPDTIDSSMPGGHAVVRIDGLRVPADRMLGHSGEGLKYAQVRLAPARLSHCMRWLGASNRGRGWRSRPTAPSCA